VSYSSLDLVFMGPPGSGKRKQASLLAERYCIPHIDTGRLLCDEVARQADLWRESCELIDRGELVPDRVVGPLVLQRLFSEVCARGFLLDGYPRTHEQAGRLDATLAELGRSIERVVLFNVTDEVALGRLDGRNAHRVPSGDQPVHIDPSAVNGGGAVAQRRLAIYREQTEPVVEIYRRRGLLVEIDGSCAVDQMTEEVLQVVGAPVGA